MVDIFSQQAGVQHPHGLQGGVVKHPQQLVFEGLWHVRLDILQAGLALVLRHLLQDAQVKLVQDCKELPGRGSPGSL